MRVYAENKNVKITIMHSTQQTVQAEASIPRTEEITRNYMSLAAVKISYQYHIHFVYGQLKAVK